MFSLFVAITSHSLWEVWRWGWEVVLCVVRDAVPEVEYISAHYRKGLFQHDTSPQSSKNLICFYLFFLMEFQNELWFVIIVQPPLWFSPGFIGFAHHHFTKFASCNLLNQSVSSSSFSIRSMLRECSGNFFPRRFGWVIVYLYYWPYNHWAHTDSIGCEINVKIFSLKEPRLAAADPVKDLAVRHAAHTVSCQG